MGKARQNPLGSPAVAGVTPVFLGSGERTHVLHPDGHVICRSGKNAGKTGKHGDRRRKPQKIFRSKSRYIDCYRCQKLMEMNLQAGRQPWQGKGE